MDFSHSHNAPGKEWIGKQLAAGLLKARKTNWNDVTLPGEVEAHALMLVGARAIGQDQARGLRPSRETINEWTSAMMLNTLTMTEAQEQDARAKAFYLIKKWTSLTYLEHAVQLYRDFLDAYAKQIEVAAQIRTGG